MFIAYMNKSLVNKMPFNESFVRTMIFDRVEQPFTVDRSEFPIEPIGKLKRNINNCKHMSLN